MQLAPHEEHKRNGAHKRGDRIVYILSLIHIYTRPRPRYAEFFASNTLA